MEYRAGVNPLGTAIAPDIDSPAHGRRTVPAAAGLGITVDETAVRRLSS